MRLPVPRRPRAGHWRTSAGAVRVTHGGTRRCYWDARVRNRRRLAARVPSHPPRAILSARGYNRPGSNPRKYGLLCKPHRPVSCVKVSCDYPDSFVGWDKKKQRHASVVREVFRLFLVEVVGRDSGASTEVRPGNTFRTAVPSFPTFFCLFF